MNDYFDPRYHISRNKDDSIDVTIYIDQEEDIDTGITQNSLRDAYRHLNNMLLPYDIHLDFNRTRNNLTRAELTDSLHIGENPIILSMENDIGASTEDLYNTYTLKATTKADSEDLVSRLNNSFKHLTIKE